VKSNGSIQLDSRAYYVKQTFQEQSVTIVADGVACELIIEYNKQPIKGLYDEPRAFEDYFDATRPVRKLRCTGE
jgi:hypothetical protein